LKTVFVYFYFYFYLIIVATGDQATADTLLNREMMIGCSCSESHRHAREHLRQVSTSMED